MEEYEWIEWWVWCVVASWVSKGGGLGRVRWKVGGRMEGRMEVAEIREVRIWSGVV